MLARWSRKLGGINENIEAFSQPSLPEEGHDGVPRLHVFQGAGQIPLCGRPGVGHYTTFKALIRPIVPSVLVWDITLLSCVLLS